MNVVEIQDAVGLIAARAFSSSGFFFDFMAAITPRQ